MLMMIGDGVWLSRCVHCMTLKPSRTMSWRSPREKLLVLLMTGTLHCRNIHLFLFCFTVLLSSSSSSLFFLVLFDLSVLFWYFLVNLPNQSVSKRIYIAQLSRMSHCTPEATLKPKRFQFMPKTVVDNVFVVQVYWEAILNTWPSTQISK